MTAVLAAGFVWIIHISSRSSIQKTYPFIRSFPSHIVEFEKQIDLKFDSYYIAGTGLSSIYLGNSMAPLHALDIDTSFSNIQEIKIRPEESNFKFRSVQFRVIPPDFFLYDGSVPCVYKGKISDWEAKLLQIELPYFTFAEPIDSNSFVIRSNIPISGENVLGGFKLTNPVDFTFYDNLVKKQSEDDGIFDTDGTLLYNREMGNIIYVYRYRNQFIVADKIGNSIFEGQTIDTISKAQIKVARTVDGITMSAPPLSVNFDAITYKHLLFVNSALRGKYESEKAWKMYSTIDVYDLSRRRYLYSFYLTNAKGEKLESMIIKEDNIYAVMGSQLLKFKIQNVLKMEVENKI